MSENSHPSGIPFYSAMVPRRPSLHSKTPRANIRLAFDDNATEDIEVKVYELNSKGSLKKPQHLSHTESKRPELKTILSRCDCEVDFPDDTLYSEIWKRGSGKLDRLESVAAEFERAWEWLEAAKDGSDDGREELCEEQREFHLSYVRRPDNALDTLPHMLAVLEKSQQFFTQEGLKWPDLASYRQQVWADHEEPLLLAFRSAFTRNGEDSDYVRDMFYVFQCLLPGVLMLSHEDRCFSEKGTYRISRCLPPLAWVRRHEQQLLHIFPAKYRLCGQGLYHLGHHCATPQSSLVLEFRARILESRSPTKPLRPWKEGKTHRSWRRQNFFS